MGNENSSILKKCNISSRPIYQTIEWSLYDATNEDQSFSAFIFNENHSCNDSNKWKHVRHPYLVKFYESGLYYKNKQQHKYILTEPVIPIRQSLDKFHKFFKLSGLYNIGDALSFLHEKCKISVNNLSIDSIFISKNDPNELWKLGSLYWCSTINIEDGEFVKNLISFHQKHGKSLFKQILPPEDQNLNNIRPIKDVDQIHKRDIYAFINLINELFYQQKNIVENRPPPKLSEILLTDSSPENELKDPNFMAKMLIDQFNRCKHDQRPKVSKVLNDQLFQKCPFVQIRQFFSNFSCYNDQEKYNYLNGLIHNIRQFPDQSLIVNIFTMIVSSRLIMSNRLIYNDVMPYFLIPNIQTLDHPNQDMTEDTDSNTYKLTNGEKISLNPLIDEITFKEYIIPHIMNLYCVHDYQIRLLLLNYLPHYGRCIKKTCLKKLLLPQILLGIIDADKELVSMTFRAMAVLIDLFGVVTILGGSAQRSRYFVSGVSSGDNNNDDRLQLQQGSNPSIRKNSIDNSSTKSNNNNNNEKLLFERRSSPDGDEQTTNLTTQLHQFNNNGNNNNSSSQLTDDNSILSGQTKFYSALELTTNTSDDDDEWPDWGNDNQPSQHQQFEPQSQNSSLIQVHEKNLPKNNPIPGKLSNNNNNNNNNSKKTDSFKTFDIKEIDFKSINYTEEIDNLFMDMTPVLDFQKSKKLPKIVSQETSSSRKIVQQKQKQNESESKEEYSTTSEAFHQINSSLFEAKNELNIDELEQMNSGWNSDSLDWNEFNDDDNDGDLIRPEEEENVG